MIEIRNPFSLFLKKIPLRFDTLAYFKMFELNGIDISEADTLPKEQLQVTWIYAAYLSACSHRYKKPRKSYEFFVKLYRWYYVNDIKALEYIISTMLSSRIMGKSMTEWSDAGDEKKK